MSGVAIVTDTSALFPPGVVDELGLTQVSVGVALDGEAYDVDSRIEEFYELLSSGARATTSQPSPGDFLGAYASAAAKGAAEVLSIHLDARVSGTTTSAELAAREAPVPVTVVDSGTVSFGVGLCVRAAGDAVAGGASASEAAVVARRLGPTLRNVFVAPGGTGGRVGEEPGWAVHELTNGETTVLAPCETVDRAIGAMATYVSRTEVPVRVAVGHAAEAIRWAADALTIVLDALPQVVDVQRYRVGAAVGAHTGPLSFGAFWWPAE